MYRTAGSQSCISCVAGSQTELAGAAEGAFVEIGASACVTCGIGQYSAHPTGGTDCIDCPLGSQTEDAGSVGTFMEVGASSCVECTIGQYSNDTWGCNPCPALMYSDQEGMTHCSSCPPNSISIRGADSIEDCICQRNTCAANSDSDSDSDPCGYEAPGWTLEVPTTLSKSNGMSSHGW